VPEPSVIQTAPVSKEIVSAVVQEEPKISTTPPVIIEKTENLKAAENRSFVLKIRVQGQPEPKCKI
jgi:hypothetical protein